MIRPTWYEFPKDENTFGLERQFMLGDSLLVAPVLDSDNSVKWYLPKSARWYNYWTK